MSIINTYGNPIVTNWHYDENGELTTILRENESHIVTDGKIILEELPDYYRKVFISNYVEIDLKQKIVDEFHYKVDYTNGIVFFHASKEGQAINITRYYGRGMFYTPSSRIWTKIDDLGNVVSTLADMEGDLGEMVSQIDAINDMAENASGIATSLETNVTLGTTLNTNLQTSIGTATTKKTQLDTSISTSTTSKSSLDTSITSANTSKSNLDTSIGNATTSKSNLDSSISSGNTLKTNLDGSISTGTTLKNNLDTNITTGNQLKVDLPPLISSAGTAKTNLDGSIATSTTKKSDLDGSISSATTKKTDLDASISNANIINNTLSNATTGTIKKATDINTTLNASIGTATTSKTNLNTSIGNANTSKTNLDGSVSTANTVKTNLDGSIAIGNSLKGELDAIISGTDYEQVIIDVNSMKQDQHNHTNKNTLDGLSDVSGKLKYNGQDVGVGDMEKSIYDTDGDGKVDVANNSEKLGGQLPSNYAKQSDLANKVDSSRVLTDVPLNAKFTDTVYTHPTTAGNKHIPTGGSSNQILRYSASGTAVWGNENNTTYTAGQGLTLTGTVFTPDFGTGAGKVVQGDDTRLSDSRTPLAHNQAISTITGLQSALDGKVNNSQVLTDVPTGAKFTDTVTTVNGKTGVITKADIVSLGIPAQDTVYAHPPGTNPHGTTKSDVGLGNVTNDKQMPISNGVLENYREKLTTLTGTSTAINLSLGNVFTHALSGNTTYSVTNAVSGQAHSFTLIITQTATARTVTFPASVKWQGGEIPDLTTASKTYVLTFLSINGGTNWLGMFGGEF